LINKTIKSFPPAIDRYVLDGSRGLHGLASLDFLFTKFKKFSYKWIVLVDEDVVFLNSKTILDIIVQMEQSNYSVAGVRDGGMINHRIQNPYAMNTFFLILNFEKISAQWNFRQVKEHQYIKKGEFHDPIENLPFDYNVESLFEPYYCFFLWLRRKNHKFLFLDSSTHEDNTSNILSYKNFPFLIHMWYARKYNRDGHQKKRIDKILSDNSSLLTKPVEYIKLKDSHYRWKKLVEVIMSKLPKKNLE